MNTSEFRGELLANLTECILPYWMDKMTDPRGGFYGRRDGEDNLDAEAPKGAILNARILWTFATAYRTLGNPGYLVAARRARDYILTNFVDREYGGIYWSLNADGTPLDTKKQFYAIGFAIYGLSEFVRATGNDPEALQTAIDLYRTIEAHSRERQHEGYLEACTRDWQPIADMRLSDKDDNACKTMNTHLHIIEGYVNLYRVWPDAALKADIENLLAIFFDKIKDPASNHLGLFFDNEWNRQDRNLSYGHDIEASWLLLEAAQVIGSHEWIDRAMTETRLIAEAALEGRCTDGSMVYERFRDGHYDNDKHWWVQAENVVGQIYLWKFHNMPGQLDRAQQTWEFIKREIVDHENGEWHWMARRGSGDDKAGFWKCPYHNSRMCVEAAAQLTE